MIILYETPTVHAAPLLEHDLTRRACLVTLVDACQVSGFSCLSCFIFMWHGSGVTGSHMQGLQGVLVQPFSWSSPDPGL